MIIKPQIGDIWLDKDNDYTLIISLENNSDLFKIIIINKYCRETRGEASQYGKQMYFHTRIAPSEEGP